MALFTNQASLSYRGRTVLSNITTGELLSLVGASKTVGADAYQIGTSISFVIQLTNAGDSAVTDLTVTDDLGATAFGDTFLQPLTFTDGTLRLFANGVLQPTPAYTLTPALTITGVAIPAGGVTTLLYSAEANEFASPDATGTITNTARITGATPGEIVVSATVNADPSAVLAIQKSISPAVVLENEALTYTFVIENFGADPAGAEENPVVTDLFRPALQNISVTLDGATWTKGTQFSYDPDAGLFETASGAILVPGATFEQNPDTGAWTTIPGTVTLTVTGTV